MFIGIGGTSGSGKSYFAENLKKILKENHEISAVVVPMDGYQHYKSDLNKFKDPKEAHAKRGAAFTYNASKFVSDLTKAKKEQKFSFPAFDEKKGDPAEK